MTEELVNNAQCLLGAQGLRDVVVLVQRLSWRKTAAVHLWVHDLGDNIESGLELTADSL